MRDPYQALGVQKSASAEDIKRAFRKLAKKLHPDANRKDARSAAKFAEINQAYEILGDPQKRKAFDRGEIDAEGKPRFRGFERAGAGTPGGFGAEGRYETFTWGPQGFRRSSGRSGGFGGFEDILGDVFGSFGGARSGARRRENEDFDGRRRGQDIAAGLTITLEEAAKGTEKRIRLPTGADVEVKVPPGMAQQIRLKGQGLPGRGGPAGDALITVTIAPHPFFRVEDGNLRLDVPIALYEAVMGAKVRVPTLERPVELTIPPGTNAGRTFRLKGKGLPAKGGRGDLFATVRLVLPERIDPDFEQLMRKWRDLHPYYPRKGMA